IRETAARHQRGVAQAARASAGEPSDGSHRALSSTKLLDFEALGGIDALFEPPAALAHDEGYTLLCQTLFRLRVWRDLSRVTRIAGRTVRRRFLSYSKLAGLVYGFGMSAEERNNRGRNINNWLRQSMDNFKEAADRELIRSVLQEPLRRRDDVP